MSALKRTNTHRMQSVHWARRPELRRSRDIELDSKINEVLSEVVVDIQETDPLSPSSSSPSARRAVAADAWMDCAVALKDHDSAKIQSWKEEIDTHLVFAGLFSAILTAFNVEAYKLLQPQDSDSTNRLLCSFTTNNTVTSDIRDLCGRINSNASSLTPNARVVNALWFCSLICSLASASISILVKQWLTQYSTGLTSVSPEIARVRQFRYDNLRKWKVEEIMMLLPILLQAALVLFLIGLVLFLQPLDDTGTVTGPAAALIGILLLFILATAVLPTFSPGCSYQSPQAWGVFVVIQTLKKPMRSILRSLISRASRFAGAYADGEFHRLRSRLAKALVQKFQNFANKPNTYSWRAHERVLLKDKSTVLDQHLLVGADRTFLDDTFLRDVVAHCLNDMPPITAVQCYYDIMGHRADHIVENIYHFDESQATPHSLAILTSISLDTLLKTREMRTTIEHPRRILQTLEPLLGLSLRLTYPQFCRVLFAFLDDPDKTVRHLTFSILYKYLSRNPELTQTFSSAGCHDFAAILAFISSERGEDDTEYFLDACDLVICLATTHTPANDMQMRDHLRDTLLHLRAFFATPLWKNEPRLLYPISRLAPRLVELEARYPSVLEDRFTDVLEDVAQHAKQLNYNGNWEDKLIILETALEELKAHRLHVGRTASLTSTLAGEDRPPAVRRPSLMRNDTLVPLDA